MTTPLATLTRNATETSLLASGRFCQIQSDITASAGAALLAVDALQKPGLPADYPGWPTPNTVGALMLVSFHANPKARTIYLVIDRDNAPLTGNYTTQVDAVTAVTYDATAGAPADVDALLQAIADELNGDAGFAAVATADTYATAGDGVLNAIRLQGVAATVDGYTSFIITSNTVWPGAADLAVYGELTSASLRVYGRGGQSTKSSVVSSAHHTAMISAWTLIKDYGELTTDGLQEQLNVATQAAIYLELYARVEPADTYSNLTYIVSPVIALALVEAP